MGIAEQLELEKRRHSEETTKADGTIAQAKEHLEAMQREFNGMLGGLQQECQRRIGRIQLLEEMLAAEQGNELEPIGIAPAPNGVVHDAP